MLRPGVLAHALTNACGAPATGGAPAVSPGEAGIRAAEENISSNLEREVVAVRKSWDEYFLDIAFQVAGRSTCPRRRVGAVVVADRRLRGAGYNGSPRRMPHCAEAGCLLVDGHCVRTIHAEINALMESAPAERDGATLYVTDYPCSECAKVIVNSGVKRVVYSRPYAVERDWLKEAPWIEVVRVSHAGDGGKIAE